MFEERVCTVCGKKYNTVSHNQKTCSKECRKEHVKKRRRNYYWKNHKKIREYQNNWLRNHYSNRESNINNIFSAFSEYLEETYD